MLTGILGAGPARRAAWKRAFPQATRDLGRRICGRLTHHPGLDHGCPQCPSGNASGLLGIQQRPPGARPPARAAVAEQG